jgi:hypothetical protein
VHICLSGERKNKTKRALSCTQPNNFSCFAFAVDADFIILKYIFLAIFK